MEIHEKHGINFQLNSKDFTASIIESPKATGIVTIPRFFRFNKQNYKVTTVKSKAFHSNTIESIIFANNSEITKFEDDAFEKSSIKKLQIPPKLKFIEKRSFFLLKDLTEFEVSPNNKLFQFYNNELLIGKSNEKQDNYDILYLGRYDLKKVTIPSSIKIIKRYAFGESTDLKSIKFEKNSQIEYIDGWVLFENLKKFEIPRKLKNMESDAFQYANSLTDLKVSTKNKVYSWYNNTLLIRKNDDNKNISFCRRDVSEIEIPRNIKEIDPFAFKKCENLVSINFEKDSILESINENAFESVIIPKEVVVPKSVKFVKKLAFSYMNNLKSIQFLSEEIEIEIYCFYSSNNLVYISFPNAKKIIFNDLFSESLKIYIRKDAEISGYKIDENKDHIALIEDLIKKLKNQNNNNSDDTKNMNKLISKNRVPNQKLDQSQSPKHDKSQSPKNDQSQTQKQDHSHVQNQSQSPKNDQSQILKQDNSQIQNQSQVQKQDQSQTQKQDHSHVQNQSQSPKNDQSQIQKQDQSQIQAQDQSQMQAHDQSQTQDQSQIQRSQNQSQFQNHNDEPKSTIQNDPNQEIDNNNNISKCCILI